jgi:hypothetical protein
MPAAVAAAIALTIRTAAANCRRTWCYTRTVDSKAFAASEIRSGVFD